MKKLLSLLLALTMALSLLTPALAAGEAPLPAEPAAPTATEAPVESEVIIPLPEEEEADADAEWEAEKAAWMEAHAAEVAAFDADTWFESQSGGYFTKESYLALNGMTEEEFQETMLDFWVAGQIYLDDMRSEVAQYEADHPAALAGFDPDVWFSQHYSYYDSKEEYMEYNNLETEEDFRFAMKVEYIRTLQAAEARRQRIADYETEHSGAFAAFDADSWFREHYSYYTKDEYMTTWDVADEAEFREQMFLEYLGMVEEKESRRQTVAEYAAEHPGVLDGFDPMAYLAAHYGYRDPKAAFMEDYELDTEAEFVEYLQYDYISTLQTREQRKSDIAAYGSEHPGATDGFDPDAFLAENYPWYDKEEFMLSRGLDTEEDFHDYLLCEWIDYQEYGSYNWWDVNYDAEKAALGGVPGELGVMVNGTYLTFADKKPYAQDGVTYVPAQELSTALGQEPRTVTQNGYSPLRASAEEAGFAVYWDADFETAVLLDLSAQAEALDSRFTILNAALEQWGMDPEKNYSSTCTIAIDATLFNSIDGDKTYAMTAALEQLTSPGGLSVSGTYDFSALESLLRDLMGEELYGYLTEDGGEEFQSLLDLLKSGDFQVRCDYESGIIYLTASSFPSLFSIMGKTYPKDVWLSWESAATAPNTSGTVGSILTAAALASAESSPYTSPVYYYPSAVSYGELCAGLLGDEQFEKKGADQVLSLDAEALTPLLYGMTSESYYYDQLTFKELDLELVVKPDGAITGSFAIRPESALSAILDYRAAGDWTLSGGEQEVHMEFHMKNFGKVTVTIEGETKATSAKPETAPPANAAVVPMDEVTG